MVLFQSLEGGRSKNTAANTKQEYSRTAPDTTSAVRAAILRYRGPLPALVHATMADRSPMGALRKVLYSSEKRTSSMPKEQLDKQPSCWRPSTGCQSYPQEKSCPHLRACLVHVPVRRTRSVLSAGIVCSCSATPDRGTTLCTQVANILPLSRSGPKSDNITTRFYGYL